MLGSMRGGPGRRDASGLTELQREKMRRLTEVEAWLIDVGSRFTRREPATPMIAAFAVHVASMAAIVRGWRADLEEIGRAHRARQAQEGRARYRPGDDVESETPTVKLSRGARRILDGAKTRSGAHGVRRRRG